MAKWLYSTGDFAARKAWVIIAIWALLIGGVSASYAAFHGQLKNTFTMPGTETQRLSDELSSRFPDANRGSGQVVVTTGDGSQITDEQKQSFTASLKSLKGEVSSVDAVSDPFETEKQLTDGQKQLTEGKQKVGGAPEQLEDGKKQIADGQRQIDEGKKQVESGQQQVDNGNKQVEAAKKDLDSSQTQVNQAKQRVEDAQKQLDVSKNRLAEEQAKLDASFSQAEAQGSQASVMAPLNQQQEQLNAQRSELNEKQTDLNNKRAEADASQAKLDATRAETTAKQAELEKNQAALNAKKKELEDGQKQLNEKKAELAKAEKDFPTQKEDLDRKEALFNLTSGYRTVSEDGSTAITAVTFNAKNEEVSAADTTKLMEHFKNADLKGLKVYFDQNIAETSSGGMGAGEIVGVVVALIVLLIMLGTLIAAGLPILMALVGVVVGILGTLSFSSLVDMSSTTYILGMMLGLAVGIDYSLFILNRHRSNLMNGVPMRASIALANGTSGNAVVFAGATVIIALLALNVTGIPFLGYMGDAAALCVFVAVLISVTLTPAVLALIGRKALPKKAWESISTPQKIAARRADEQKREESPHGWLKIVLARPVLTIIAGVLVLGAIAIPMGQMRMGLPSAASSPVESTQYQAYKLVKDKFGEGVSGPVLAVAHTPSDMSEAQAEQAQIDIADAIKAKGGNNVKAVIPGGQTEDRTLQIFQVIPTHGPNSAETVALVDQLRQVDVNVQGTDVHLGVTGLTGGNIDVSNVLAQKLPLYLAVVMGLSFIVLILVFRSILVPLVASAGFLFSILASFGAVVAVYQMGFMGTLFGVHDPGAILAFLPILMIGILFGLAMDYQVFLVSGMREAYVHGKDAKTAVVAGYNHAVRVVVAAMIIMISVFGGFIFADDAATRPIGFGLAFGVLVDAFVVRMTLTPAIMTLLGDKAWWMPKWLDKLVPNMDVEGATLTGPLSEGEVENESPKTVRSATKAKGVKLLAGRTKDVTRVGGVAVLDSSTFTGAIPIVKPATGGSSAAETGSDSADNADDTATTVVDTPEQADGPEITEVVDFEVAAGKPTTSTIEGAAEDSPHADEPASADQTVPAGVELEAGGPSDGTYEIEIFVAKDIKAADETPEATTSPSSSVASEPDAAAAAEAEPGNLEAPERAQAPAHENAPVVTKDIEVLNEPEVPGTSDENQEDITRKTVETGELATALTDEPAEPETAADVTVTGGVKEPAVTDVSAEDNAETTECEEPATGTAGSPVTATSAVRGVRPHTLLSDLGVKRLVAEKLGRRGGSDKSERAAAKPSESSADAAASGAAPKGNDDSVKTKGSLKMNLWKRRRGPKIDKSEIGEYKRRG